MKLAIWSGYEVLPDSSIFSLAKREFLKAVPDKDGYLMVYLRDGVQDLRRFVHSLVGRLWVGSKPAGMVWRHLDCNQLNNWYTNLAFGTQQQNVHDSLRNGTFSVGEQHYRARLTVAQVREIKLRLATVSDWHLAPEYGVHYTTIRDIRVGKTWKHVLP